MIGRPLYLLKKIPSRYLKITSDLTLNLLNYINVSKIIREKEKRIVEKVNKLDRILVVADYNIGDSLLILPVVDVLKYYLINAKVDYICNEGVASLINKVPNISNAFPVFSSSLDFSYNNLKKLMNVIENNHYDIIFNFCPFFNENHFKNIKTPILYPWRLIIEILESYRKKKLSHISYRIVEYVKDIISLLKNTNEIKDLRHYNPGINLYISDNIIQKAREFIKDAGFNISKDIVFIHADSSSEYTFINGYFYKKLVSRLLCNVNIEGIVLGPTYNFRNINTEIYNSLETENKDKVIFFPKKGSLEFFAAVVNFCSIYIGLDTGPLHIAAARKFSQNSIKPLNNKTAIVGLFKVSNSKIYGYDSFSNLHINSNQDAPAIAFEAKPKCKSISCTLQKIIKTCRSDYCDRLINADDVYLFIKNIIDK